MITAIIRNRENTLVLDFPRSIYDLYEKLQSVGIMKSPKQIPLTDSEDEDIGVKLFSESDFGQHLLLTLSENNSLADANLLTYIVQNASEDIKETLEQDITPSPSAPAAGARGRSCPRSRGLSSAAWAVENVKARREFC